MLSLRNEFIMAPVKLGYSDRTGVVTQKHLDFYGERSKHVGAVALEPLYMDPGLRELPTQLGIDDDNKIPGFTQLLSVIHGNGAKAIAHINHPGRMANPKLPGNYYWSSTDSACENGGAQPLKMDRSMMDKVVKIHVEAAQRAEKAGFDLVELQMGHGYLLAQFLSPAVNNREDEYGGGFVNRRRFPLEVFHSVKKAISIPVIVRLSADEMIPNGFHSDEMKQLASILEKEGASALHITAGSACSTPPWFFQHMFIPKGKTWEFAAQIKSELNIPVIFVGRITSAKDIQLLKEKYGAEYIALGRALVADPDFAGKYLDQEKGLIRPCLSCSEGCLGGVKSGIGLGCVVNPLVGTGLKHFEPAAVQKRYAIVGGGLAGMEAAITLTKRGHKVVLYEKNKLGGQYNLAWLPPHKETLKELVDYFVNELAALNIEVRYEEADKDKLVQEAHDGVIMATGALPAVPPIKGLTEFYWTEFLEDEQLPEGKTVLLIGGGLIGLEVASKLVEKQNHVIVVEMMEEMARGMEMIEKTLTLKKLKEKGAEMFLKHTVTEIDGSRAVINGEQGQRVLEGIDKVVVATGMKSYVPFDIDQIKIFRIGDAWKVGKAQEAIRGAYELAMTL
ncbi:MAG: FAD-dependent oxidoreductase [Bacteroidales bacterium]|nr:FAD-dependent oxidoreductase [Bacteroidales bacterium]